MPTKSESFSHEALGTSIRRKFRLREKVVRSSIYQWRDSPAIGEFGPQNGAEYRATVEPLYPFPAGYGSYGRQLPVILEVVWYFHGGYGSLDGPTRIFRAGAEKSYNETHKYSVRISDPDDIEPGHYMVSAKCRAVERIMAPETKVEQAVASLLSQTNEELRSVVTQF